MPDTVTAQPAQAAAAKSSETKVPPAKTSEAKPADDEGLGRSRGGFSSKLHIATDALGNPVRFILTAGQRADVTQGEALIAGWKAKAVIADKGYDSDKLVEAIRATGAEVVIPPRSHRKEQREYDRHLYKERNGV